MKKAREELLAAQRSLGNDLFNVELNSLEHVLIEKYIKLNKVEESLAMQNLEFISLRKVMGIQASFSNM